MAAYKDHIIIIGAGVTGLTTAVFLAEAGHKVTIVAAHVPGDKSIEYTSPWAGAHWHTHAAAEDTRERDWDVQTYDYWLDLLQQESKDQSLPESGLKLLPAYKFWNSAITKDIWWSPYVQDFAKVDIDQEPVRSINKRGAGKEPPIEVAITQKEFAVNVPQYLLYLQERARKSGAEVVKARLPTDSGLSGAIRAGEDHAIKAGRGKAQCLVNATGLGAAKVCGDKAMFPMRGQTVLVKGEAQSLYTRSGPNYDSYCIPRPGAGMTILGGTRGPPDLWDETPDPEATKRILEHASFNIPELMTGLDGGFEVVSVQCGLRPGRKGGARVQKEVVDGKRVVHAYGHAGGGYQNSIGSARLTMKLVEESLLSATLEAKL